ncbi:MAG: hypothetical protein HOV83_17815 [Catenulispora sp.]|nr:hypothetical protein [Catenulispora sp.]
MAVAGGVLVSGFAVNQLELSVRPPAVTGSVTLQAARNTDPRARQFLDDVQRGEYSWLSMPGTFVEGTVRWHLPHRLHPGACQLAVQTLPEAPGRLGTTSTGTTGAVAMGDDFLLKRAFQEPGPANSLGSVSYMIEPTDTDGTITFVVAYPDQQKVPFADAAARASAVVECENHASLFNQTRNITGPVATLPLSEAS